MNVEVIANESKFYIDYFNKFIFDVLFYIWESSLNSC